VPSNWHVAFFVFTGLRDAPDDLIDAPRAPSFAQQRLMVSDFHQDGEEYTIRINEKGIKRRTIGLHFAAELTLRTAC
jgi:hypothetical protein